MGYFRNKDSIIKVNSHPKAKLHDHNFDVNKDVNKYVR